MGAAGLQVAESRVHKLLSLEHTVSSTAYGFGGTGGAGDACTTHARVTAKCVSVHFPPHVQCEYVPQ